MLQPINPKAYNLRAEIGRLLIEFVIERKKNAGPDSLAWRLESGPATHPVTEVTEPMESTSSGLAMQKNGVTTPTA